MRVPVAPSRAGCDTFRDWTHEARVTYSALSGQLAQRLATDDQVSALAEAAA